MTPLPPSFEVFMPLRPRDLSEGSAEKEVAERVMQVMHGLFSEIEAEVLPTPQDTTTVSETAALIRALPLHDTDYDAGYLLNSSSRFGVRFATPEEWGEALPGEEPIEPVATLETSVTAWSSQQNSELLKSVFAMRRFNSKTPEGTVVVEHESLMGIAGEPTGRWFKRRYMYDTDRQAQVREQIGLTFAQDETARVDAMMFVRVPDLLSPLFDLSPSINLRSSRSTGRGGEVMSLTARQLIVPNLRVVRALISRGVD